MNTVGQRIRLIRRLIEKRQYDLGREIDRSPGWISLVESDDLTPSENDIRAIANALGVEVKFLVEGRHADEQTS